MNAVHDDIICDLLEEVQAQLGAAALSKETRTALESKMRVRWGGQEIYIQKRERDVRAQSVRMEYNGRNRSELQAKYGISRAQFYKILKGG